MVLCTSWEFRSWTICLYFTSHSYWNETREVDFFISPFECYNPDLAQSGSRNASCVHASVRIRFAGFLALTTFKEAQETGLTTPKWQQCAVAHIREAGERASVHNLQGWSLRSRCELSRLKDQQQEPPSVARHLAPSCRWERHLRAPTWWRSSRREGQPHSQIEGRLQAGIIRADTNQRMIYVSVCQSVQLGCSCSLRLGSLAANLYGLEDLGAATNEKRFTSQRIVQVSIALWTSFWQDLLNVTVIRPLCWRFMKWLLSHSCVFCLIVDWVRP